ncbi:hypothetical protein [Actinophytocola algeriensis]|uniref:Uncharacterized protein n=1 Tax=Actinophytocola algeriensis TaxID=1768010 RepID=A0A7W7Q4D1_9PSEU|nr:hypothetical protein [Actinophytocola algeriensis]MBB4906820.1 hypothetical protein [Actinophytocola algeriensis]MBE1478301.1 hypothetical protein [Actinophytocola algeriensis]
MFDDDTTARNALQTLNDEPAPPPTTTVEQVLRRGRRRVLAQRVSAVAGVVAVVAAIGVTAVLVRQGGTGDGGVRVAEPTTAPPAPAGPLPGWRTIEIDEATCKQNPLINVPGTAPDALLPQAVVEPAFVDAVVAVTGPGASATTAQWEGYSPKADGPRGYVVTEIPMSDGNGQLQLEAYVYGGTPTAKADASLYAYGDCKAPARHTLPDGTVLQLFQRDNFDPEQPMQHLQIFRPDGHEYIVTSAGWSEADMVPVPGSTAYTIEGGRRDLPTDDAQLAEIATTLVANLG